MRFVPTALVMMALMLLALMLLGPAAHAKSDDLCSERVGTLTWDYERAVMDKDYLLLTRASASRPSSE